MFGEWRAALAACDYKKMLQTYQSLNKNEKFSALEQCDEFQRRYILRETSGFDLDFVSSVIIKHIPEGYIGIGYGWGDGQEYQDGNLPVSNEWILVKDISTPPQEYSYEDHVKTWLHEELMDARGRWGKKPDIEENGPFDFWNNPPEYLKLLQKFDQDWCTMSTYRVFLRDGSILLYGTYQW